MSLRGKQELSTRDDFLAAIIAELENQKLSEVVAATTNSQSTLINSNSSMNFPPSSSTPSNTNIISQNSSNNNDNNINNNSAISNSLFMFSNQRRQSATELSGETIFRKLCFDFPNTLNIENHFQTLLQYINQLTNRNSISNSKNNISSSTKDKQSLSLTQGSSNSSNSNSNNSNRPSRTVVSAIDDSLMKAFENIFWFHPVFIENLISITATTTASSPFTEQQQPSSTSTTVIGANAAIMFSAALLIKFPRHLLTTSLHSASKYVLNNNTNNNDNDTNNNINNNRNTDINNSSHEGTAHLCLQILQSLNATITKLSPSALLSLDTSRLEKEGYIRDLLAMTAMCCVLLHTAGSSNSSEMNNNSANAVGYNKTILSLLPTDIKSLLINGETTYILLNNNNNSPLFEVLLNILAMKSDKESFVTIQEKLQQVIKTMFHHYLFLIRDMLMHNSTKSSPLFIADTFPLFVDLILYPYTVNSYTTSSNKNTVSTTTSVSSPTNNNQQQSMNSNAIMDIKKKFTDFPDDQECLYVLLLSSIIDHFFTPIAAHTTTNNNTTTAAISCSTINSNSTSASNNSHNSSHSSSNIAIATTSTADSSSNSSKNGMTMNTSSSSGGSIAVAMSVSQLNQIQLQQQQREEIRKFFTQLMIISSKGSNRSNSSTIINNIANTSYVEAFVYICENIVKHSVSQSSSLDMTMACINTSRMLIQVGYLYLYLSNNNSNTCGSSSSYGYGNMSVPTTPPLTSSLESLITTRLLVTLVSVCHGLLQQQEQSLQVKDLSSAAESEVTVPLFPSDGSQQINRILEYLGRVTLRSTEIAVYLTRLPPFTMIYSLLMSSSLTIDVCNNLDSAIVISSSDNSTSSINSVTSANNDINRFSQSQRTISLLSLLIGLSVAITSFTASGSSPSSAMIINKRATNKSSVTVATSATDYFNDMKNCLNSIVGQFDNFISQHNNNNDNNNNNKTDIKRINMHTVTILRGFTATLNILHRELEVNATFRTALTKSSSTNNTAAKAKTSVGSDNRNTSIGSSSTNSNDKPYREEILKWLSNINKSIDQLQLQLKAESKHATVASDSSVNSDDDDDDDDKASNSSIEQQDEREEFKIMNKKSDSDDEDDATNTHRTTIATSSKIENNVVSKSSNSYNSSVFIALLELRKTMKCLKAVFDGFATSKVD